jgi:hypothetical protein
VLSILISLLIDQFKVRGARQQAAIHIYKLFTTLLDAVFDFQRVKINNQTQLAIG